MSRERDAACVAERGRAQETGDTAAPRRVRLQHVDGTRRQHPLEVPRRVAVFARGDRPSSTGARSRTKASPSRSSDDTGSSNQVTPTGRRSVRPRRAPASARTRRSRRRTARRSRRSPRGPRARGPVVAGSAPIFILTRGNPRSFQADSCRRQLVERVGREAAAAVRRDGRSGRPEQLDEGTPEQAGPSDPRSAMSTAAIAMAATPSRPRFRTARSMAAKVASTASGRCARTMDARCSRTKQRGRHVGVRVAETGLAARSRPPR